MGDPKRPRKKYQTPMHPWEKSRIEEEKKLLKEYGLKNKREIMKMQSVLRNLKSQAKKHIAARGDQAEKEKQQLLSKVFRLGFTEKTATLDDVLGLTIDSVLRRRLQTLVYTLGLARSVKQARQFIIHRHITVNGKKVTSPSYLVTKEEEATISFSPSTALSDAEHPERIIKENAQNGKERESGKSA